MSPELPVVQAHNLCVLRRYRIYLCSPSTSLKSVAVGSLMFHWLDALTSSVKPQSGVCRVGTGYRQTYRQTDRQRSEKKVNKRRCGVGA